MKKKKTRSDTQVVAGMNSQIRISGILGFGATQRSSQGNQEGDKQARETRKKTDTRRGKLAITVAHQSLLIPNQIFFLWYEEFVLNILIFVENSSRCS